MRRRGRLHLSRQMFDGGDPIWEGREPFDRRSAWIDLLQMANYRPKVRVIAGAPVRLERGQLLASERYLAQRWHWTRAKVRRFLGVLAGLQRIVQNPAHEAAHAGTIITLCNYERYNPEPTNDRPTERPAEQPRAAHERPKAEVRKEGKSKKERDSTQARALPAEWKPDGRSVEIAADRGVDVTAEAEKFRDWATAKGETKRDWDAAFRNWVRRAEPERGKLRVIAGGGGRNDDRPDTTWWSDLGQGAR